MEVKIKENEETNEENSTNIQTLDKEVKQMKRNQTRNKNEIKALTEDLDRNTVKQENKKATLKEMEK